MNTGLIILRVASETRDAQNEREGAGAAQLHCSSDSVAASASSQQHYNLLALKWSSHRRASLLEVLLAAPRGGTRRHLEEGRELRAA